MPKPGQEPDPALGPVIRRLREDRGETREALAHRSGIALSMLADIENSRRTPSWVAVRALATALEVKLGELGSLVEREG